MGIASAEKITEVLLDDLLVDSPDRSEEAKDWDVKNLKANIEKYGLITPITVAAPNGEGKMRVIAGKRRVQAVKELGLKKIKAVVLDLGEVTEPVVILSDNLQRKNVNPIIEARLYKKLLEEKTFSSQSEIGRMLCISQAHVSQRLKLLEENEAVQQAILNDSKEVYKVMDKWAKSPKAKAEKKAKGKVVKLADQYLTPEGSKAPLETVQIRIGKDMIYTTFALETKGLTKELITGKISKELAKLGEKELVEAIERIRKQTF